MGVAAILVVIFVLIMAPAILEVGIIVFGGILSAIIFALASFIRLVCEFLCVALVVVFDVLNDGYIEMRKNPKIALTALACGVLGFVTLLAYCWQTMMLR